MSSVSTAAQAARDALERGYRTHPVLAAATGASLAGMMLTFPLLALDPVQIAGSPAWTGPFRLFASMAVLSATFLWIGYRMGGSITFSRVGLVVAAVAVLQPTLAVLRVVMDPRPRAGVPSLVDQEVAAVMAMVHLTLLVAGAALLLELFRRPLGHPTVAWGIRLGLVLALVGMLLDPAFGIPWVWGGSGWRPAHLVGMHGLQLLPLTGWALSRRRQLRVSHQVTLVGVAAVCHAGVVLVLAWQAARGDAPLWADPLTVAGLVVVLAGGASSSASVLAHAHELRVLAQEARTASERRQAMLAQDQLARARKLALKEQVTHAMLQRVKSERDRGATPGSTLRIRHPADRLASDERPTDITQPELLAV